MESRGASEVGRHLFGKCHWQVDVPSATQSASLQSANGPHGTERGPSGGLHESFV